MKNNLKNKKTIIFVTGGPGTGKSYVSKFLMDSINGMALLSYDDIKEREWDRFGFDNKEQKERLNWFALEEYYLTIQKLMWKNETILTEYPFYQRHREELRRLVEENQYQAITVLLYGDWKKIYERACRRDAETNRHPGHLTNSYHIENFEQNAVRKQDAALCYEEFYHGIEHKNYDIQIGTTIKIDVTDLAKVNYKQLLEKIYSINKTEA